MPDRGQTAALESARSSEGDEERVYRAFSNGQAEALLLVASGIGFFFYVLGGALGERFGRLRVPVVSAVVATGLTLALYFAHASWLILGALRAPLPGDQRHLVGHRLRLLAESLPTRVRGTAIGWLGAMFAGGLIIGSGIWTILIGSEGAKTMLIVGGGFAVLQLASCFLLPHIRPGQPLEEVAA